MKRYGGRAVWSLVVLAAPSTLPKTASSVVCRRCRSPTCIRASPIITFECAIEMSPMLANPVDDPDEPPIYRCPFPRDLASLVACRDGQDMSTARGLTFRI
jgi:hypothetical protein